MNRQDFTRCIAKLAAAYRENLSEVTLEVYYERLQRCDLLCLDLAAARMMDSCEFFPRISQLLALATEIENSRRLALEPPKPPPVSLPWEEDPYRKALAR